MTKASLDILVTLLNNTTGNPVTRGQKNGNTYVSNVGHYTVESAYGGVKLVQIMTPQGGDRDVFRQGYVNKKMLSMMIYAYIDGIFCGQKTNEKSNTASV